MKRNIGLKYIVAIVVFAISAIVLTLGISSWIITSSTKIEPVELTDVIVDKNLQNLKQEISYDGKTHKPHEDLSLDTAVYDIVYYDNDTQVGKGNMYSGFLNAGSNYKVKYVNKVTHIITVVPFKINKAEPNVSVSTSNTPVFYTPSLTLSKNDCTITGVNNEKIDGNISISQSGFTNEGSGKDEQKLSFNYKFTPTGNYSTNYKEVSGEVSILLKSVCYNGTKYYSRIENALSSLTSGTVNIVFGTNPTIYENATIPNNVTLYLNYNESATQSKDEANKNSNGINWFDGTTQITPDPEEQPKGWDYDSDPGLVYLNEGVTLIVNGTLTIGGTLSAAPCGIRDGHTSGDYSILLMKHNSNVIVNGSLNCYGFIYQYCGNCNAFPYSQIICDNCANTNCLVTVNGSMKLPFVIRDMGDGSCLSGFKASTDNEGYTAPAFNQFTFENISSNVTINYGATVHCVANIYASSLKLHQGESINILSTYSTNANSLIQLKPNSYLNIKYDIKSDIVKYDFYGDLLIDSLNIDIETMIMSLSINTKVTFLPISWQFDVTFNKVGTSSTVDCAQMLKLMPGAKLKINTGVTFNATKIVIYDEYNDPTQIIKSKYPSNKNSALFEVGGILNVDDLGGEIKSINPVAKLNIIQSNNVTSYEAINCFTVGITTINNARITAWETYKLTTSIKINNPNIYRDKIGEYVSTNITYSENNTTYYYWGYYTDIKLSFNTGIANIHINDQIIKDAYQGKDNNGLPIVIESYFPKNINFDHHNLQGWYYIYNGQRYDITQETESIIIFEDTTFYAIWETIKYDINIGGYLYSGCENKGNITDENGSEFTIFENGKYDINTDRGLPIPVHSEKYTFGGWFLDAECSNLPIVSIKGTDYVNVNSGTITIYGLWFPQGTLSYTINYIMTYPEGYTQEKINEIISIYSTASSSIVNTRINEFSIPMSCFSNNFNTSFKSYFIGWYDENGNLLDNSTENNSGINNKIKENLLSLDEKNKTLSPNEKITSINIYCKWGSKSKVTLHDYRTSTGLLTTRDSFYLIPGSYKIATMNDNIKSSFAPLEAYDGSKYQFNGYSASTSATSLSLTDVSITNSEQIIYLHYKMYVNLIVKGQLSLGTDSRLVFFTKDVTLQAPITFTINGATTTIFAKGANNGKYNENESIIIEALEGTSYTYVSSVSAKGYNSYTISVGITTNVNTTIGVVGKEKTEIITISANR